MLDEASAKMKEEMKNKAQNSLTVAKEVLESRKILKGLEDEYSTSCQRVESAYSSVATWVTAGRQKTIEINKFRVTTNLLREIGTQKMISKLVCAQRLGSGVIYVWGRC